MLKAIGVIFCIVILIAVFSGGNNEDKNSPDYQYHAMAGSCKDFITQSANDPDALEFEYGDNNPNHGIVTHIKGNIYSDIETFRAKNGFGALIRVRYKCVMRDNGDTVALISLKKIN